MRRDAYKPRLLLLLKKLGSASTKQLARDMPCSASVARKAVADLIKSKEIHVLHTVGNTRIYGPGRGPDLGGDPTAAQIKEEIKAQPRTARELEILLGKTQTTISRALKRLRKAPKKSGVYILTYRRREGSPGREAPVYAYGDKPDAVRPDFSDRVTTACRRYHAKMRVVRQIRRVQQTRREE